MVTKGTELEDVGMLVGVTEVGEIVVVSITGRDRFLDNGTVVTVVTTGLGVNVVGGDTTVVLVVVLSTNGTGTLINGVTTELTNSFFDLLVSLTFIREALEIEIEAMSSASFRAGEKNDACSLKET